MLCSLLRAAALLTVLTPALTAQGEVPLQKWTHPDWPNGLDFGEATGISFGDYDADGWHDIFCADGRLLWRNLEGRNWELAADLAGLIPDGFRYGSSFGDYDQDGLPDIVTEPRNSAGDTCMHLLHNLGGGLFEDVAVDPNVVDFNACQADSETACWADVDGDGDLDLFLPVYPPNKMNGIDNQFFHNLGPTGPGGMWHFTEMAAQAGLLVPAGAARPEGAQFVDADRDGDLDLYSNGHLYQNLSSLDAPLFQYVKASVSGIRNRNIVDEGVLFTDYDLDGDLDLLISYAEGKGIRIWESWGDGTWFETDTSIVEDYKTGAGYGLSAADWDLDGDLDFMALDTFRRNLRVEEGLRRFVLASDTIPPDDKRAAAPAWGDWDLDGDPDLALGNGIFGSYLYENTTYGPDTDPRRKRGLRVRPVRDSASVDRGLETEYGTLIEVHLRDDPRGLRRIGFPASSSGYINQNEYPVFFALPPDPDPGDPLEDLHFDLSLDYPVLGGSGTWRVDKYVNPALGNLDLAELEDPREVTVFRSGRVDFNGIPLVPSPAPDPVLLTTTGGLIGITHDTGLPDPVQASSEGVFVGIEVDTHGAAEVLHVKELILDGRPGKPFGLGRGRRANILAWDVTVPGAPVLAGAFWQELDERNRRGHWRVDLDLEPDRVYRFVAHVQSYRETPIAGPVDHGVLSVTGGLLYRDAAPQSGAAATTATVDPSRVFLALRISPSDPPRFLDLRAGAGLVLSVDGEPRPGASLLLEVQGPPATEIRLVAADELRGAEQGGLRILPAPERVLVLGSTDAAGLLQTSLDLPAGLEAGRPVFLQAVAEDAGGTLLGSNLVAGVLRR